MLEIVKAPHSILSQKTKPVAKIDNGILKLIEQMKKSLDSATDPIGVGLAAPQIGKSLKIFIAKPGAKSKVLTFINPRVIKSAPVSTIDGFDKKTRKLEGCLSLLNIWGSVERFDSVWISYLDETGKKHNRRFDGFLATILQHEIDHLDGILFPKRVLEQKGTLYKSEKDEKGEDIFEEIKL